MVHVGVTRSSNLNATVYPVIYKYLNYIKMYDQLTK